MAAATQVFNTAELLEAVLLELPFKDILQAQAVTRSWKQAIEASIKLQRVLFIAPDGPPVRPLTKAESASKYSRHGGAIIFPVSSVKAMPIFGAHHFSELGNGSPIRSWQWEIKHISDLVWHSFWWELEDCDLNGGDGIRLPPAYKNMFLTKPPITACKLSIPMVIGRNVSSSIELHDNNGITLGMIAGTAANLFDSVRAAKAQERLEIRRMERRIDEDRDLRKGGLVVARFCTPKSQEL